MKNVSRRMFAESIGMGAAAMLAGCSGASIPLLTTSAKNSVARPRRILTTTAPMSRSLYDTNGSLVCTISTDGLNMKLVDKNNTPLVTYTRGDYGMTIWSQTHGTVVFDQTSQNVPGTQTFNGLTVTVADSNNSHYLAPNATTTSTLQNNADTDQTCNMLSGRLYTARSMNSYSDDGLPYFPAAGSGTGSGCTTKVCPNGASTSPHCLGVYAELFAVTVGAVNVEIALAILEGMTAGLASLGVAAAELALYAFYTYLINQTQNCLSQ